MEAATDNSGLRPSCLSSNDRRKMKITGPFHMQTASDVQRDGLGVELISGDKVVAEVFRCDADHSLIVTTFGHDLPLVALEELISFARDRLGEFEDGAPLPALVKKEPIQPSETTRGK